MFDRVLSMPLLLFYDLVLICVLSCLISDIPIVISPSHMQASFKTDAFFFPVKCCENDLRKSNKLLIIFSKIRVERTMIVLCFEPIALARLQKLKATLTNWTLKFSILQFHGWNFSLLSPYVRVYMKMIPWKFRILNPKTWVRP